MKTRTPVQRYVEAAHESIHSEFADLDNEHRERRKSHSKEYAGTKLAASSAKIQVPQKKSIADKSIHYLERLVHRNFPE